MKPLRGKRAEPKRTAREGQSSAAFEGGRRHVRAHRFRPAAAGGRRLLSVVVAGAPLPGLCRDRLRAGPWWSSDPKGFGPEARRLPLASPVWGRGKTASSGAVAFGASLSGGVTCAAPGSLRVCGERGRLSSRPVLKHGPRSPARARVAGFYETRGRSESEGSVGLPGRDPVGRSGLCLGRPRAHRRPVPCRVDGGAERERACGDPKDGELRLGRAKPGETPVEARSDSDVQIDRPTRA